MNVSGRLKKRKRKRKRGGASSLPLLQTKLKLIEKNVVGRGVVVLWRGHGGDEVVEGKCSPDSYSVTPTLTSTQVE
jgi:hypothetical protein